MSDDADGLGVKDIADTIKYTPPPAVQFSGFQTEADVGGDYAPIGSVIFTGTDLRLMTIKGWVSLVNPTNT